MQFLSPDNNNFIIIRILAVDVCLSNQIFCPHEGFTMTTMSKGCRDGGDRLAITNNQHAPDRYLKESLTKYVKNIDAIHHE